jgi:hypothetical protein
MEWDEKSEKKTLNYQRLRMCKQTIESLTIFYTKKMLCHDDGVSILRNSLQCKDAIELLYSQFY